jgi:peptidoglycan/LPS O-acetylase OafA/YrhL
MASLQLFRGAAALLIVLYHASGVLEKYFGGYSYARALIFASCGVQFFFVLSGFIILYAHRGYIGRPRALGRYLAKRLVRIYPPYWIVSLALLPFWLWLGQGYHRDLGSFVLSMLLVPQGHEPHLAVAWSLVHEMLFYLLFGLCILDRRFLLLGPVWIVATVAGNVLYPRTGFPASFLLSWNNVLFVLGGIALSVRLKVGLSVGKATSLLVTGVLLFGATAVFRTLGLGYGHTLLFGLSSCVLVLGSGNPAVEAWFAGRKLWLLLGNASYAIYLVHYPVISLAAKVYNWAGMGGTTPRPVIFATLVLSAVAAGVAFHLVVEKPILRFLRRCFVSAPAATV